jgi:hypothetical protein
MLVPHNPSKFLHSAVRPPQRGDLADVHITVVEDAEPEHVETATLQTGRMSRMNRPRPEPKR